MEKRQKFGHSSTLISTFHMLNLRRNKVNPVTTEALKLSLPPPPPSISTRILFTGVALIPFGRGRSETPFAYATEEKK